MAIPEQELKNFDFSGGMNTELGLVNTDEKTAKNLENVELQSDGSAERRSGLSMFNAALTTSEVMDISSQRSSAGWVYPAVTAQMIKTVDNDVMKDVLFFGNTATDTASTPTVSFKEISGIADFETSPFTGGQLFNKGGQGRSLIPNFRHHYTSLDNITMITHQRSRPMVTLTLAAGTNDIARVDVLVDDFDVTGSDSVVQDGGNGYRCIQPHTSAGTSEPGFGATWRLFWVRTGVAGSEPAWVNATAYGSHIDTAWNVAGISFTTDDMFTHTAFLGGRMWYAGMLATASTLYVSQPVEAAIIKIDDTSGQLGHCFRVNDPNSATDSSPTAADGGTIKIREAGQILSITEFREGLIIFATHGVWAIPNAGNFNALSFEVLKISDVPIAGPEAFAKTDNGIMYFGETTVQAIGITDNGNQISQELVDEFGRFPIRTFYNSISTFSKKTSFAIYNKSEQRVYWFTTFVEPTYEDTNGPYQSNNFNGVACAAQDILVYDIKLKAWYKYQMRKDATLVDEDLVISDAFTFVGDFGEEADIINLAGDELQNAALDDLVSSAFDGNNIQEFTIVMLTTKDTLAAGADKFRYGLAHLQGDLVQDFDNLDAADDDLKSTFDSEILTQHMNFADISHNKQAPYIHTIFRRVESGIVDAGGDDLTPGGCLLQLRWNWASGPKAGAKFQAPFQAYKPFRWNINPGDGSLPDIEVVLNRHKLRGRGRALQLQYPNDGTKRFHLLGYQLEVEATRKV